MPHLVPALRTTGPYSPFERTMIERREPRPREVVIGIAYVGICHSDIHTARAEWGETIYPLVPGHEIVGTVTAVGRDATKYAVGDRVGVGCYVDSCRECVNCRNGEEQRCSKGTVFTYDCLDYDGNPTLGGYSKEIVVDQDYVLSLPDSLEMTVAAPLLCAGITLYEPLKRWGAGPGVKVAVVGMGGLGHIGVQIAHAMGAEVTVLSRSLAKADDGRRLGADAYYATEDPETFRVLDSRFDLIVSTVSGDLDVDAIVGLLGTGGVLVFVGMPPAPQSFQVKSLIGLRRCIAGSLIGSVAETQEMLDFCGAHGIGALVELVGADDVDAVYDRVVAGHVRYRAVMDVATI